MNFEINVVCAVCKAPVPDGWNLSEVTTGHFRITPPPDGWPEECAECHTPDLPIRVIVQSARHDG